jgi:preprotein translocase subunit SecE
MNSNVETVNVKFDIVKLVLAVAFVVTGIIGFYYFADLSILVRTIGLLVCVGISVVIALNTEKGRNMWGFFQNAQIEVRKVVWPTREETLQTTLIVIFVVILVAISLWLIDMFLGWSIRSLLGQGG